MIFDTRTEANIATLLPKAQDAARIFMGRAVPAMAKHGITVKIIGGTRTYKEQNALYAKGRGIPGRKVTNARGGYSWHNFGIAWDIGLFDAAGRYLEESPRYAECGKIGADLGLVWGGSWKSFPDEPHFQLNLGLDMAACRARVAAGKPVI
jgi:peptidoglycan LD-endopeptidase CwlK